MDLSVEPHRITLDIEDNKIDALASVVKSLGYPLVTQDMGFIDSATSKAKSFVSCAIGKIN